MSIEKDLQSVRNVFQASNLGLVDRSEEVKQLMYAVLTKEHMLLQGSPGTGKSLLADNAFDVITGASNFKLHLSKDSTPDEIFGPIDFKALREQGEYIHNTKDYALDANLIFFDELFDASDATIRSILGLLNERVWKKGKVNHIAQLHTCIATSNYRRDNEVTAAILDRFVFKAEVGNVEKAKEKMIMYKNFIMKGNNLSKQKKISFVMLQSLSDIIVKDSGNIKFSNEILTTFDTLREEFKKETKKEITDRTANKALKVVKASAILNGRDKASYEDLRETRYVFCTINNRDEERYFEAICQRVIDNLIKKKEALEILNESNAYLETLPTDLSSKSTEFFTETIKELQDRVNSIHAVECDTVEIKENQHRLLIQMGKLVESNREKFFEMRIPNY